ncbi:MAG: DUF5916 domain-containing protein, partial [Pseudomonadota bacterium]
MDKTSSTAFAVGAWLFLLSFNLLAFDIPETTEETLQIPKFPESEVDIDIDGKLDESVWSTVPMHSDKFIVSDPDTLKKPIYQTTVKLFYTEQGVYIGLWNEQPADTLVTRLSARDKNPDRDGVSITFDTSGGGLYGYWFGLNLGDSISDGQVLPERQFSRQWDGPWRGATAVVADGWTAEYFLPWSMVSMPQTEGKRQMGIYISRKVAYLDERWTWPALPRSQPRFLSALQPLELEGVNPRQQYAFFPFASSTYDFIDSDIEYKIGADIFWRPSSNLQLNATLNPDFGQVESDDLVVNLSAFETFFGEKRLFFLEGQEIFTTSPRGDTFGGGTPLTLVNTRRIGSSVSGFIDDSMLPEGAEISSLESAQFTELLGAARVTGQYGNWRYGVLGAFENDTTFNAFRDTEQFQVEVPGRDFGVVRGLYEDSTNGYKAIGWLSSMVAHPMQDAYVHAMDGHYLSPNGVWKVDGQLMFSDVDDVNGYGGFVDLVYTPSRGNQHRFSFDYFDRNLDLNDLGFFRRNDSINFRYRFERRESGLENFRERQTRVFLSQEYNNDGLVVRSGAFFRRRWVFQDLNRFTAWVNYFPARWDDRNSDGNGNFRIEDRLVFGGEWESDRSKPISFFVGGFRVGEELGDYTNELFTGVNMTPIDRWTIEFRLRYFDRNSWLI